METATFAPAPSGATKLTAVSERHVTPVAKLGPRRTDIPAFWAPKLRPTTVKVPKAALAGALAPVE